MVLIFKRPGHNDLRRDCKEQTKKCCNHRHQMATNLLKDFDILIQERAMVATGSPCNIPSVIVGLKRTFNKASHKFVSRKCGTMWHPIRNGISGTALLQHISTWNYGGMRNTAGSSSPSHSLEISHQTPALQTVAAHFKGKNWLKVYAEGCHKQSKCWKWTTHPVSMAYMHSMPQGCIANPLLPLS